MTNKKYPRTYHIPWSPWATNDDRVLKDFSIFEWKEIVITEKMDGENTTMTRYSYYARSIDSNNHPSRDYLKWMWWSIRYMIPEWMRICWENLYAEHSLWYDNLESYFYCFNIWKNDVCLSVDETIKICNELNIFFTPILYKWIFDETIIQDFINSIDITKNEWFVIRNSSEFDYSDFNKNVAKWVRKWHVTTDTHWTQKKIIPNKLKNE